MDYKTKFERYETKYLITQHQKMILLTAMQPYMRLDQYGHSTIRNIYYDTKNYRLIRHSLEKPIYKEKLRIRSYNQATANSPVFVELKKKYNGIVYKRRLSLTESSATDWLLGKKHCNLNTQICFEIDYFIKHYETLHPVAYKMYDRRE